MLETRITPNSAPVAVADSDSVLHDQWHFVSSPGLLDNDTDADQDPLTAELYSGATNGVATVYSDGSWDYMPDMGFVGTDSFQYRAFDGTDYSDPATVTIQVTNNVPVAGDNWYSVHQGDTLSVTTPGVLDNDTDADQQDTLTAALYTDATNGVLTLYSDGSFDYEPDMEFVGQDSFQYQAFDGAEYSDPVTVTIDVTNTAPSGSNDFYSVLIDETLYVSVESGVLANDGDADNDSVTVKIFSSPHNGYVNLNSDGSFDYTPDYQFEGTDSFRYRVFDGAEYSAPVLVAFVIAQAQATVFTVNTANDTVDANAGDGMAQDQNGDTSLRAAIQEGNLVAGPVGIRFAAAMEGQTITLATELPSLGNDFNIGTFTREVTVSRDTTAGEFRIFSINSGKRVNMYFLTLTNGRVSMESGGAIRNRGTLTLMEVDIHDNYAFAGGGLANEGTMGVTSTYIYYNEAGLGGGGGIYNSATNDLSIQDSEIFVNHAPRGGGIYNESTLQILRTDIYSNSATSQGGGIYNSGNLTMTTGIIYANELSELDGEGGGLYNTMQATATLSNVSITYNDAGGNQSKGGGVYAQSGAINLNGCTILNNDAAQGNGGYEETDGDINLDPNCVTNQDFVS